MEQTMVKGPRSGWREDEIDQLWREIQRANASGQPLRSVFEEMGGRLGRKPNSVRNYYYMQLRGQEGDTLRRAQPFETFTEAEVRGLLKSVLRARAQGQSVRACVMALSQGDHARMLRYQNKYRSLLKKRPELVAEICRELEAEGVACESPIRPAGEDAAALRNQIAVKAGALGDPDVQRMLTGINALMDRAIGNDPQIQGDRLRVRLDMALLRYDELSHAVGDMLLCCKEYLGQEDAVRTAALPAFLTSLSQHVSQTENALAK